MMRFRRLGPIRRLGRIRRRPDSWATPHERARAKAAQRMDGRLHPDENAWLDRHLRECRPCRLVAVGYEADRSALKRLAERTPEPPRDLWARTAAAVERESARADGPTGPVRRVAPIGALSGVLVVAVVVGASLLSSPSTGPTIGGLDPSSSPSGLPDVASSPTAPRPTPIIVGAGDVSWVRAAHAGGWGYTTARVGTVCSTAGRPDCAPIDDARDTRPIVLPGKLKSVIGSPTRGQAVVVGSTTASGNTIFVVALPTAPTPTPTIPPATPTPDPTASVDPSTGPIDAVTPSPSPTPTTTPDPTPTPESTPMPSPEPTVAAAVVIASGVRVIGESAAFSADGAWFAFTARPADGSTGPDIYVWRVGDETALPVTTDHRSVFASWFGERLLGSRPDRTPDPVDGTASPVTFALDPATSEETVLPGAGWRPVVDPSGQFSVGWVGSIALAADGNSWLPVDGSLVLQAWPTDGAEVEHEVQVIATVPVTEFDIRWDETGMWLAVWIADPVEPTIGRLSLLRIDPETGAIDRLENAPVDVAALPGFSIGNGRLAWATPPGQEGEGSRVRIVAWTADGVGGAESVPGEDVIVVR